MSEDEGRYQQPRAVSLGSDRGRAARRVSLHSECAVPSRWYVLTTSGNARRSWHPLCQPL